MNKVRIYAGTLLLSAMLLFVIQPMVGRMLLPTLGGTAVVWATSLVFFQAVLLAGYLYAHFATRLLGVRRQAVSHIVLMGLAALTLPFVFDSQFNPSSPPITWLLESLAVEVGLVFFLVSTSAPMLQRWYASLDAPGADDPYFLYAASNVGSLGGLLAYPFVVEPFFALDEQATGWALGYGLLIASTTLAAVQVWRHGHDAATDQRAATAPKWPRRLKWTALAFVPSSMLLGATNQITTDLAAIPLLWVIPLALYILSFVLVFARRRFFATETLIRPMVVALIAVGVLMGTGAVHPLGLIIGLHLIALTLVCLVYHGALVDDRPEPIHLTEFYIWMSLGGVLGGAFNALLSPYLFDEILEYPLLICAALAWLPTRYFMQKETSEDWRIWAAIGAAMIGLLAIVAPTVFGSYERWLPAVVILVAGTTAIAFRPRVAVLILAAATLLTSSSIFAPDVLERERSAYGAYQVTRTKNEAGTFHKLVHGNTTHGTQAKTKSIEGLPLAYFHPQSPLGQVMVKRWEHGYVDDVGVVGLGCGAMAAYAREGMTMEFFEIDPVVVDLARDTRYFTFLENCAERCKITVGDGRLQLASRPDRLYDVLVLDAYNSDSVPVHLLTREAVELYLDKLKPGGILLFQATNRHTEIVAVVASLARELDLVAKSQRFWPREKYLYTIQVTISEYVVVARDESHLDFLGEDPRWKAQRGSPEAPVWTDSYANLLYYYSFY